MLSQVKLIAEPWDVGPGGYQVGNFPVLWAEWNGDVPRHDARLLARRGERRRLRVALHRLERPLRSDDGRRPFASINFITAHDGFTLRDLVSYNEKHNEANGEDNRDGTDDNRSWNCGVEGPTEDPGDQRAARAPAAQLPRRRCCSRRACRCCSAATSSGARRAATTTRGARTTRSPGSTGTRATRELSTSRGALIALRRATRSSAAATSSAATRRRLRAARRLVAAARRRRDDAARLENATRARSASSSTARRSRRTTADGEHDRDDSFLLLFNAHHEPITFTLPTRRFGVRWQVELATASAGRAGAARVAARAGGHGRRRARSCCSKRGCVSSAAPTGCS